MDGLAASAYAFRVIRLRAAAATVLVLALALAVAACGGGSSSSNPSSGNYDPAHTTLKDAGLAVCSEDDTQVPQNLSSGPGFQASRAFFVAKDCNGSKTSPDVAMSLQYDSKQSVDAAFATVKTAVPNSSAAKYGPLIVITTGPNRQENLAAIEQALQAQGAKSG
jgi:hypothetical protein